MSKNAPLTILQISKKFPFPLKDGESIAIHSLGQSLVQAGARVDLLAMNTLRHWYDGPSRPASFTHYHQVDTAMVDNRIKPISALRNLFTSDSYHIERFISDPFAQKLCSILKDRSYDIIQLETIYLTPYIPIIRNHSQAKICVRTHNLEHEIWERIVANTPQGPKRWYLRHLTDKLARYEKHALSEADMVAAISERDLASFRKFGYTGKGVVCPIGLDMTHYDAPARSEDGPLSISFIGSLDWMPNIEGLKWFLQDIWPALHREWPALQLHIAGRNTPSWLVQTSIPGGTVHGEVPEAITFIQSHPIMIVPLRSGSGMRAKILEGMALGKVVITTSLGLEGINATDGREVLIADDLARFREQIRFLQQNPDQLAVLGAQAKELVQREYNSAQMGQKLLLSYREVRANALS